MSEQTYKVTLPYNFLAEQRIRAGITVSREDGYEGPLDAEQLEAIQADPYLTIEDDQVDAEVVVTPPAPTKADLLAQAETEGLTLDGINSRSKVADITAAIEAAHVAQIEGELDVTEDEVESESDAEAETEGESIADGDEA